MTGSAGGVSPSSRAGGRVSFYDCVGLVLRPLDVAPDELEGRMSELLAFQAAGVHEICFRLHDDPADAIKLIAKHVIPHLPRD